MPFYTANQRDKAEAANGGGSNNFSNINSTLQAQLYAKALREYPSRLHHAGHVPAAARVAHLGAVRRRRQPVSRTTTSSSSTGTRTTRTLGRSGIHHNILGAYNFMIIDDIAGVRPRLDDVVELWPIDVGYDHFAVNNLSYHGQDLTVVWDKPGDGRRYYPARARGLLGLPRRHGGRSPWTISPTCPGTPDRRGDACSTAATPACSSRPPAGCRRRPTSACPTTTGSSTCSPRPAST